MAIAFRSHCQQPLLDALQAGPSPRKPLRLMVVAGTAGNDTDQLCRTGSD